MTRQEFKELWQSGIVILDGATGSNLQKAGLPAGVCPEQWILDNKEVILTLQREFVAAGTQILYAPTFGANSLKLGDYGLGEETVRFNTELVKLCKEAADGKAFVAGDMTMTGKQLYPFGDLEFEELIDVYKEQAQALYEAGVDLFIVETMMSLQETRAAIIAIKEICDLPVMATMTFEENGYTMFGNAPESVIVTLQSLGADAVGMNCSTGPEKMAVTLSKMAGYADVPLIAKPNAGLPVFVNGVTEYPDTPEQFSQAAALLVSAGARIIGGCCGTTPEHIKQLKEAAAGLEPVPVKEEGDIVLAAERSVLKFEPGDMPETGEEIDPETNEELAEELLDGDMDTLTELAEDQADDGAEIIALKVDVEGGNEKELMLSAISEVSQLISCPLMIKSASPEVVEAALRNISGRAMVDAGLAADTGAKDAIIRAAEKYGAVLR